VCVCLHVCDSPHSCVFQGMSVFTLLIRLSGEPVDCDDLSVFLQTINSASHSQIQAPSLSPIHTGVLQ